MSCRSAPSKNLVYDITGCIPSVCDGSQNARTGWPERVDPFEPGRPLLSTGSGSGGQIGGTAAALPLPFERGACASLTGGGLGNGVNRSESSSEDWPRMTGAPLFISCGPRSTGLWQLGIDDASGVTGPICGAIPG